MSRLLIVDDEVLLRTALVAVFEAAGHTVDALGDGHDVVGRTEVSPVDVVVLDIHLPGSDGIDVAAELARLPHRPRVLLLTAAATAVTTARALAAPVEGVMLKSASATRLCEAVDRVLAGERVVDPDIVPAAPPALTPRELDLLIAAADGAPVSDVAARLFLAPATVRNRLTAILAKTGARNRFEAVQRARESGWI